MNSKEILFNGKNKLILVLKKSLNFNQSIPDRHNNSGLNFIAVNSFNLKIGITMK
jgi:hypothetical protein